MRFHRTRAIFTSGLKLKDGFSAGNLRYLSPNFFGEGGVFNFHSGPTLFCNHSQTDFVSFGDIELPIKSISSKSSSSDLVPKPNFKWFDDASHREEDIALPLEVFQHLRWLAQKYCIGQDMFLTGFPSSLRRALVLKFAALSNLEVEYMAITPDTTEADLKQRREIINNNILFVDQPPVRAAINGRLLILDGIEKAERNVLPTLNNLLENREMNLDDGRHLISKSKWDDISTLNIDIEADHSSTAGLVPVHPNFRVIALGLSIPPYAGNPMDVSLSHYAIYTTITTISPSVL